MTKKYIISHDTEHTLFDVFALPRLRVFPPKLRSAAFAPPVFVDPGPPRRFLLSFAIDGVGNVPMGGILLSPGRGVCVEVRKAPVA